MNTIPKKIMYTSTEPNVWLNPEYLEDLIRMQTSTIEPMEALKKFMLSETFNNEINKLI